MMTINVITRVFNIKFNNTIGTCFAIEVDQKQYFVTAKHVINNANSGDTVGIAHETGWLERPMELIGHSSTTDISVFSLPHFIVKRHPMPATREHIVYGQDVYFLGFPFGLKNDLGDLNNGFPAPIIKKAILSNVPGPTGEVLLLDGLNNPGFSGGPVVFKAYDDSQYYKVAGVISGYRAETENALLNNSPTAIQYRTNTGIIIAYTIDNALELINQNPGGTHMPEV